MVHYLKWNVVQYLKLDLPVSLKVLYIASEWVEAPLTKSNLFLSFFATATNDGQENLKQEKKEKIKERVTEEGKKREKKGKRDMDREVGREIEKEWERRRKREKLRERERD